jgi:hypothetical protein
MTLIAANSANADMIDYWNGAGGAAWIARQEAQEVGIALVTDTLLARAELRPGERVIDIGCGTATSRSKRSASFRPTGGSSASTYRSRCLSVRRCGSSAPGT